MLTSRVGWAFPGAAQPEIEAPGIASIPHRNESERRATCANFPGRAFPGAAEPEIEARSVASLPHKSTNYSGDAVNNPFY